jgi:DNA-binding transcriptional regulator LsrR (DeoR family)
MIGRGPHIGEHIDPMVNVTLLWVKCGRQKDKAYCATVPPFLPGTDWRAALDLKNVWRQNEKIDAVLRGMASADFVFASAGPLNADKEYYEATGDSVISEIADLGVTPEWLKQKGIIGDINYAFFDQSGQSDPDCDFFLGLSLDDLRLMAQSPDKRVVLVAGKYKGDCVRAALRGGLCSVLITDHRTAEHIL